MSLKGKIALVTGASRGIGRGIAVQLGEAGATVYVTGRKPREETEGETELEKTAREVSDRGGEGVVLYCDHSDADDVRQLFDQLATLTDNTLDILVNNAFAAVHAIGESAGKKFWECDPLIWDTVNNVGLRNHYICTVYAARLMVPRHSGLIVTVSSPGGLRYLFNVAYGIGKAAKDRLAGDTAVELRPSGVTSVSLWPGAVRTETIMQKMDTDGFQTQGGQMPGHDSGEMKAMFEAGESVEYAGKAIVALASDPNVLDKTGKVLITADLGREYGFLDIDGRNPPTLRSVRTALEHAKYTRLAAWIPEWIRMPGWLISAGVSKL